MSVKIKKELPVDETMSRILILYFVILLIPLVMFMNARLPNPCAEDKPPIHSLQFSEERARKNLERLSQVGVHVSGSEAADVLVVKDLVKILYEIKNSVPSNYSLDIDVQKASGTFQTGYYNSVYMDVTNVVAKLEPKNANLKTTNSILLNCHFDAFPGSLGATDDFVNCVSILEVIEVVYKYGGSVLQNPIVCLFNGAEEIGLGGSHGFVAAKNGIGHPWSKNLKGFINLDAIGAGGREILFQTAGGNNWLLKSYAKAAKHPFASVLGEEAFEFGLIAAGTDFKIFMKFGSIPGLDMAFIENGWVYHTKLDNVAEVSPGSIQHLGDNLLGLVEHIGNLDFESVQTENIETTSIFFDVFGLFVVYYTKPVGIWINVVVAATFISIAFQDIESSWNWRPSIKIKKRVSIMLLSSVVAWSAAVGAGALSGAFLNLLGYYRPFHSYPYLAIILFGLPAVLAQILTYSMIFEGSQKKSWLAGKFTFAILLLFVSFVIRSAYVLAIEVIFATFALMSRRLLVKKFKRNIYWEDVALKLIIAEMVPFIYMSSLTFTLLDFFVPMLGHTPVKTNSNVFLGVLCSATTAILAFNGLGSYFVSCKKTSLILMLFASIFILNPFVAIGLIGKIPFQGKTPMRLRIQDTARTWYNSDMTENRSDAGYCLWPQDPNVLEYLSEISKVHPQVGNYKISDVSSCPDLYCSQPLYRYPSGFSQIPWIWRSDKIHQTLKDEVEMRIRKRQVVQPGMFKIELIFQGPPLNSLALRTAQNWEMRKIVLATANETFGAIDRFDKQLCYINLCKGYFAKDLHMTVILEETLPNIFVNESNFKSDLMDVFLVGHIMRDVNNSKFKDFVQKFPSWTDVHSWTSIVKQYTVTTHS